MTTITRERLRCNEPDCPRRDDEDFHQPVCRAISGVEHSGEAQHQHHPKRSQGGKRVVAVICSYCHWQIDNGPWGNDYENGVYRIYDLHNNTLLRVNMEALRATGEVSEEPPNSRTEATSSFAPSAAGEGSAEGLGRDSRGVLSSDRQTHASPAAVTPPKPAGGLSSDGEELVAAQGEGNAPLGASPSPLAPSSRESSDGGKRQGMASVRSGLVAADASEDLPPSPASFEMAEVAGVSTGPLSGDVPQLPSTQQKENDVHDRRLSTRADSERPADDDSNEHDLDADDVLDVGGVLDSAFRKAVAPEREENYGTGDSATGGVLLRSGDGGHRRSILGGVADGGTSGESDGRKIEAPLATFLDNGIECEPEITFEQAVDIAKRAASESRGRQWKAGDAVNILERFGERSSQYIDPEDFAYPVETLSNYANVAKAYPLSERRSVAFTFHQTVYKHEARYELLDRALSEGWDRARLREEAWGAKPKRATKWSLEQLEEAADSWPTRNPDVEADEQDDRVAVEHFLIWLAGKEHTP